MSLTDSFEDVLRREELHFAAADGDVEKVTRLINEGHQLNVFDELGKTPLHYAAERGHLDVMRLLLASGADVNAHDERVIGNTVLRDVASTVPSTSRRFLSTLGLIRLFLVGCY
jgi:ankyrin repeat protein